MSSNTEYKIVNIVFSLRNKIIYLLKIDHWVKRIIYLLRESISKFNIMKTKKQVVQIKHSTKRLIKLPTKTKKKQTQKVKKETKKKQNVTTSAKKVLPETPKTDVYILELANNKIYVGKSSNVDKRIDMHLTSNGSVFTKKYPPTGKRLPRLGKIESIGDACERDETLRYMYVYGINNVRGWKYTSIDLTPAQRKDAESNIREVFDLCRKCGKQGHFANECPSKKDRFGVII